MTEAEDESKQIGTARTAEHYSKQWGRELDFQGFVEANPEAAKVMPGRQLGWMDLFERIRSEAASTPISVYDAGCGFGDIARRLFADPAPSHLNYIGADIHGSLDTIHPPKGAKFIQWDMAKLLPDRKRFDFIICRAALHHTPDPARTYAALASQLADGGTLAVSVYAKKAPMREAVDDALRNRVVPMSNDEAMATAAQFTKLGRDLQSSPGTVTITEDLPFLGIRAGSYSVQSFIYEHFIKCWHNAQFSTEHCDLVNFDWYHPPYAYRFTAKELTQMALSNGLRVTRQTSIAAQHYLEAVRSDR